MNQANQPFLFQEPLSYLETLSRITTLMGPEQGFLVSVQAILSLLAKRHGFLRPHLVIFDPETRTLRLCVADGVPRKEQVVYEPGMGVTGQVFVSGKPIIIEQMKDHPVFLSRFFARTEDELASCAFISVPVLAPQVRSGDSTGEAGRVIGVLSIDIPRVEISALEVLKQFLEVVAGIIAAQAAHMQTDMAKQQHFNRHLDTAWEVCSEEGIVAVSPHMRGVLEQAGYAAQGRAPVLLMGESGTGKSHLAAFIHALSERHVFPLFYFSCCSCVGLSGSEEGQSEAASNMTSEEGERRLFGYRKGAFPEAFQTQKGLIELAHCSSLYLKDVDILPLTFQTRLLQLLREQTVIRLGGGNPIPVDVRVICSSTRYLEPLVMEGLFLEELYQRLAVFPLHLEPLRKRPADILPLALFFLRKQAEAQGRPVPHFSASAQALLQDHLWSGNIPELIQCLQTALSRCDEAVIRAMHLPVWPRKDVELSCLPFNESVALFEQELLIEALQHTHGNMLKAARYLQTSYRIFNYKIKKYGIDPHSLLPSRKKI